MKNFKMNKDFDVSGIFDIKVIRNGNIVQDITSRNLVTNEGKNAFLDSAFNGTIIDWEVGLISGSFTASATNTYASHPWTSTTLLDTTFKPMFFANAASGIVSQSVSSVTDLTVHGAFGVVFQCLTAGSISGVFLQSSTSSILFSESANAFSINVGDYVFVKYTFSMAYTVSTTYRGFPIEGCIRLLDAVFVQDPIPSFKMGLASAATVVTSALDTYSSHSGWTDIGVTNDFITFESPSSQAIALDITSKLGARFDFTSTLTIKLLYIYSDTDSKLICTNGISTITRNSGDIYFQDFRLSI